MALVSGRGSTLNPNARPFIPAAYRQVEDFSSEWWNLVQNSTSFHNYWMSERQESSFEGPTDHKDDDITNLLPDTFDFGYDEEFSRVDAEFEDFVKYSETYETRGLRTEMKSQDREIAGIFGGSIMNSLNLQSMPSTTQRAINTRLEPPKSYERPVQWFSPSNGMRLAHQLR